MVRDLQYDQPVPENCLLGAEHQAKVWEEWKL